MAKRLRGPALRFGTNCSLLRSHCFRLRRPQLHSPLSLRGIVRLWSPRWRTPSLTRHFGGLPLFAPRHSSRSRFSRAFICPSALGLLNSSQPFLLGTHFRSLIQLFSVAFTRTRYFDRLSMTFYYSRVSDTEYSLPLEGKVSRTA